MGTSNQGIENSLDILGGCEVAPLDKKVDLRDSRRFAKLELTKQQQIQMGALASQLPSIAGLDILSNSMVLTFPEGIQGSLMKLKSGAGYTTTLQNSETGNIVGTAALQGTQPQTICLGVFTAMSIASGQYFLTQINNSLTQISSGLDKILEFLYGDKRAELLSEVSFIQFAHKNYKSVMACNEQRIATLISLQSAKKVAMKDIEFYLSDLGSTMTDKKSNDISATVPKMVRIKECLDLSLQLYTMSNLLEVYYSQNYDPGYISFVQSEATVYISKCEKQVLSKFGALQQLITSTKEGIFTKVNKTEFIQHIDGIVAELEAVNDSPLQTVLNSSLNEIGRKKQYYLSEGDVYLKIS